MLHTLLQGKKRLSREAQKKTELFVSSQLTENGAFMDKNGNDDLYYTAFGLMLAYVFNLKIKTKQTEQWLEKQDDLLADLIYYSSFIRSKLLCKLLESGLLNFAVNVAVETKQQSLSDFTYYPHDDKLSPYSIFLLLALKEDLGIKTTDYQKVFDSKSLTAYHVATRGYSNIKGSKTATTNATVSALAVMGQLFGYWDNDDLRYLRLSQDECGGYFAGSSAPIPDLLSTAMALFMLKCYAVSPRINPDSFIDAHWHPSGGFCATLLDETCDVECTFHGLLALGASK